MALLEYENQMFLDAFHEDGLLITARGLGVDRIFLNFLKLYTDPGNLVLVLNTNHNDEDYFLDQLKATGCEPLPKVITAEVSVDNRHSIYMAGGVLFVTSRILVVDMLTNRIPIDLITGILVFRAHKVMESCQEAFILRLYREKNKTGFVKAFSDQPQAFTSGFCHVERVMKSLFLRKLFLWPRFHASVVAFLDQHKVDVVELQLQMTQTMLACQTALLDLISACIKELKRCNPSLDTEEITVEYSITRDFEKIVTLHMDPVWHQLSAKTKQIIADLKTLRLLLQYLTQYDCVNFYSLVNSIKSSEKTFGQNAGWLFMDAAESLIVNARLRVYGKPKKTGKMGDIASATSSKNTESDEPILEECPKWEALKDVLDEIHKLNQESTDPGRVLVVASDDKTCSQIKEYLCGGGKTMLKRLFEKTLALQSGQTAQPSEKDKKPSRGTTRNNSAKLKNVNNGLTLTQMVNPGDSSSDEKWEELVSSQDAYYGFLESPVTVLHPLHGSSDPHSMVRTLRELQPKFVVLYDAEMAVVRQLEVFRASRPGKILRVYFLVYEGSTEEQRYLTSLRKEKDAFEYLIKEKATMVIPEERDGRLEEHPDLCRDTTPANATVNTRKGGMQEAPAQRKVIVDMREFRSELPALIHRRGIDIEPRTIEVGDYILTPEMCVERKSVSDLIGSLNSGRLYNQAVAMSRHYKHPVLLIEFDANKSFALQGKYTMTGEINSHDVTSRLTLLTLHFPRLRVLWCQSPYATAELFDELKQGRPEPDTAKAIAISAEHDSELLTEKYNITPQNMLLKMPGINSKNAYMILNKVESLAELVTLREEDLVRLLESERNGQALYRFLHHDHKAAQAAAAAAAAKPTTKRPFSYQTSKPSTAKQPPPSQNSKPNADKVPPPQKISKPSTAKQKKNS